MLKRALLSIMVLVPIASSATITSPTVFNELICAQALYEGAKVNVAQVIRPYTLGEEIYFSLGDGWKYFGVVPHKLDQTGDNESVVKLNEYDEKGELVPNSNTDATIHRHDGEIISITITAQGPQGPITLTTGPFNIKRGGAL